MKFQLRAKGHTGVLQGRNGKKCISLKEGSDTQGYGTLKKMKQVQYGWDIKWKAERGKSWLKYNIKEPVTQGLTMKYSLNLILKATGSHLWVIIFWDFMYLFLERGERKEKERDRNMDVQEKHRLVVSHTPPTRHLERNPGKCPDQE